MGKDVNECETETSESVTKAVALETYRRYLAGETYKGKVGEETTDIPYEKWIETIKTTVPPKFLDINLKAFEIGYNL